MRQPRPLISRLFPAALLGLITLQSACMPVTNAPPPTPLAMRAPPVANPAPSQPSRPPEVIENNRGGNVMATIGRRNQLERWGGPVEIRGYCGSACTLFITLPNACLGPDASVGFHAPRLPGTQIIPPGVDEIMGNYYRGGIRARWNAEWRHSLDIQRISAAEYVRLDPQTRLCPT